MEQQVVFAYNREFETIDHFWHYQRSTTMGRYLFDREYGFIEEHVEKLPANWPILDICCGPGYFTTRIHAKGRKIYGVDLSEPALKLFREASKDVPLSMGDALCLPVGDNSFGGAIATQCVYHLDHNQFFPEVHRVLRPGGVFMFDAVNFGSYKGIFKNLVGRAPEGSADRLSYEIVTRLLNEVGFEIREIRGYNWPPFSRDSDSKLVYLTAGIEQVFQLPKLKRLSPKILVAAVKK